MVSGRRWWPGPGAVSRAGVAGRGWGLGSGDGVGVGVVAGSRGGVAGRCRRPGPAPQTGDTSPVSASVNLRPLTRPIRHRVGPIRQQRGRWRAIIAADRLAAPFAGEAAGAEDGDAEGGEVGGGGRGGVPRAFVTLIHPAIYSERWHEICSLAGR